MVIGAILTMITKDLPTRPDPAAPIGRAPPRPGDVFARRYTIEDELGEGGFGIVYRARDEQLGRDVALKVLRRRDPVAIARFLHEGRAAAAMQTEHVVVVHDVGADDLPYIAMELLEGRDLQAELELRGRLPVATAVGHVQQAILGLAHAHAQGITHRDLKPRNLFLAERGDGTRVVKLLDFGIAKSSASGLTESGATLGTPRYMAPELLRDARTADARSDVYGLGVLLYELVTASPIFDGESIAEIATKIALEAHVPMRARVPELPAALEAVVDRCLAKEPARRFADVAELARALAPFAPDTAPLLPRIDGILGVPRVPATTRPPPRPAWRLPVIALGAGAAVAIGLFLATRATSGREGTVDDAATSAATPISGREGTVSDGAATSAATRAISGREGTVSDGAATSAAPGGVAKASAAPQGVATSAATHRDGILEHCTSSSTTRPQFLVTGMTRDQVCGQIAKLGCDALRAQCAAKAVSEDDRRRCRDFLGELARREVCP